MAACIWSVRGRGLLQNERGLLAGDGVRTCVARVLPVERGALLPPTFFYPVPSIFQITVHPLERGKGRADGGSPLSRLDRVAPLQRLLRGRVLF